MVGTRRVHRRRAEIALERGLSRRGQIQNIDCARLRVAIADLYRSVAEHGVLPHQRLPRLWREIDPVGVAGHDIQFDEIAASRARYTNTEVIRGFCIAISACFVQPDPAVMADDSYAAAAAAGVRRPIPHRHVALDDGVERRGGDMDA